MVNILLKNNNFSISVYKNAKIIIKLFYTEIKIEILFIYFRKIYKNYEYNLWN
tara:strand:+ start:473 stop:631 length:159 start_codon:yes stop_codon:yes gene_type:complete